jgi:gluconolactonase
MECLATGFGLIEGPVWDAGAGLYFSDAAAGGVNLLDRTGNISTVVPKRRGVGGMAMHGADALVVGGRDMAFSADGRLLYHADARADVVRVYDVQADGALGPWRPFATFGGHGTPDGMKVAVDGSVWVAVAHAGIVRVFNADGSHRRDIEIPLPLVTSLCFGGDDLRDLYVVTGSKGGPSDRCGSIYRMRSDVAGVPMHAARVRV